MSLSPQLCFSTMRAETPTLFSLKRNGKNVSYRVKGSVYVDNEHVKDEFQRNVYL